MDPLFLVPLDIPLDSGWGNESSAEVHVRLGPVSFEMPPNDSPLLRL